MPALGPGPVPEPGPGGAGDGEREGPGEGEWELPGAGDCVGVGLVLGRAVPPPGAVVGVTDGFVGVGWVEGSGVGEGAGAGEAPRVGRAEPPAGGLLDGRGPNAVALGPNGGPPPAAGEPDAGDSVGPGADVATAEGAEEARVVGSGPSICSNS